MSCALDSVYDFCVYVMGKGGISASRADARGGRVGGQQTQESLSRGAQIMTKNSRVCPCKHTQQGKQSVAGLEDEQKCRRL